MEQINNDRILKLKGGYNFRDLGGIINKHGKSIKKNKLIRSDELSNLNDSDLEMLAKIGVKTVVDFRTDQERKISVDKLPSTCKQEIHLDILSANMEMLIDAVKNKETNYKNLMLNIYKELVLSDKAQLEYKRFFQISQNSENNAIIYHCSAGKDRTGVATALILEALNVDWRFIEDDYMLSNVFLKEKYKNYITQDESLADLFLVRAEYLSFAMDEIKKEYGSIQDYLKNILKVDLDRMIDLYCEKY